MNTINYDVYKSRRNKLHEIMRKELGAKDDGLIVLFGDFENERHNFRQESTFYYYTGVTEPGIVLLSYLDGKEFLYLPNYAGSRAQWLTTKLSKDDASARKFKVSEIKHLGNSCAGYSLNPLFKEEEYAHITSDLETHINSGGQVYSLLDVSSPRYYTALNCYKNIATRLPALNEKSKDISPLVHEMRREKDTQERAHIQKAVDITINAHETVMQSIKPDVFENELQATIEGVFTRSGATTSFPSIVATGKNTTILHYLDRNAQLKDGDLLVVDIGAEYQYYAADLTRTYPVSGTFTKRQREIYNMVLSTQAYIASKAGPGMYLSNPDKQEQSLHHLAVKYLEEKGYGKYFMHGIGHFMGLDVHDTGNVRLPLKEGDVFTIEPGIYITDESLGVRIEDDYMITNDGCVCLSAALPKEVADIEALMKKSKK